MARDFDLDFAMLDGGDRSTARVVRLYQCGKRVGVVYDVDGRRCATLLDGDPHGAPRVAAAIRRAGFATSGEIYTDHRGDDRRVTTGRRA